MDRYLGYLASCSSTRGFAELEFRQNQLRSEPGESLGVFNVSHNLQNIFKVPQCTPKHTLNTSPTILAATSAIGGRGK